MPENLPQVCHSCESQECTRFTYYEVLVYPDYYVVPVDCPFRLREERMISEALAGQSDFEVMEISGDIWSKHNFTPRYVDVRNARWNEMEYIATHFRRNQCVILFRHLAPHLKPWAAINPGSDAPLGEIGHLILDLGKKTETSEPERSATDDLIQFMEQKNALEKIKLLYPAFEHADDARKSESPKEAAPGDTVRLKVQTKELANGEESTFNIFDVSGESPVLIDTVTGTNRDGNAFAEWEVDLSKCKSESPKLEFDAGAKGKKAPERGKIPVNTARAVCDFVEIPDVQFHHNSALPALDSKGALIGSLVSALSFAHENPDKEVVLFGHSDSSGDSSYNYDLSQFRAEAVKAILDDDEDLWLDCVDFASKVEDFQRICASLASGFGWNCDPGGVDNQYGPKTEQGLKGFQTEYNTRYNGELAVDGKIGPKIWGAMFRLIRDMVVEGFARKTGEQLPPMLTYGHKGEGVYPCGESIAIEDAQKDNYRTAENRRVEIMFFDKGECPTLKPAADKAKVTKKEAVVYDERRFERKVVAAEEVTVAAEGEVFYDTAEGELGIVDTSKMTEIQREIEWMDAFTPYMKVFLEQQKGHKEKDRKAEAQAVLHVMKEFVDADSDEEAKTIIENLDQRISEVKNDILSDEEQYASVTAAGHKMKPGDVREVFWVSGKRMVRVRGKKIRSHNRWFSKKQVLQQLKKEQREAEAERKKRNGPAKEAELKIFEKKLFSTGGSWSKEIEEFNKNCNINFFEESTVVDGSIGAQFLRHSAEATFGATANWKEDKAIKIGGKAEGSFALAQAQGTFNVNLPSENGLNLFDILRRVNTDVVDEDCTDIFLLVQISTKGSAFVGCCAAVSMDLGVSVKENQESGGLESGLELFAGARTGADTTLALKMKLYSDEDRSENVSLNAIDWTPIAEATYGVWAAIGIGLEAGFQLGYFDSRFRFQAKLGLVLKAGAGQFVKGSIDAANGAKLIWTIARGMNWKHMSKVLDGYVHDLYQGLMLNCFLVGETLEKAYYEFSGSVDEILQNAANAAERGLGELKDIDDSFDRYIPGYSGFKQFNANFLLLRSTYNFLREHNKNYDLKSAAIDRVETAEREGRWKYATWQMKVNLIYDMRYGGAGIGGFSEEKKENAVIAVLRSARHAEEFAKIVKSLQEPDDTVPREPVYLDELLDFEQQQQFDQLKRKFEFRG